MKITINSIIITAIIAVTVIIVAAIVYKTIDDNSNTAFNNAIMNYEANDKKVAHELRLSYESLQSKYNQYVVDHGNNSKKLDEIRDYCANTISNITNESAQKYSKKDVISYLTYIIKKS